MKHFCGAQRAICLQTQQMFCNSSQRRRVLVPKMLNKRERQTIISVSSPPVQQPQRVTTSCKCSWRALADLWQKSFVKRKLLSDHFWVCNFVSLPRQTTEWRCDSLGGALRERDSNGGQTSYFLDFFLLSTVDSPFRIRGPRWTQEDPG